ncbi:MAG: protein phosphatase CheZ [Deltaproteobacteria bacterium]|nr:protein phosphatase CheZ [Deltaproteobacteria bacterium]
MEVVIDKKKLLSDLGHLQTVLREYHSFLHGMKGSDTWTEEGKNMLQRHKDLLNSKNATLKTLGLVNALLQKVLAHITADPVVIHQPLDGMAAHIEKPGAPQGDAKSFQDLIAQMNTVVRHAPLALQEKIRYLLVCINNLFKGVLAHNPDSVGEAMNQINLLTSNRVSQNLVREIAQIARDIYSTLTQFTDGLPLDTLNESADGMSIAVNRLRMVISRLEDAANQNLEGLETIERLNRESLARVDGVLKTLRDAQNRLGAMKISHPHLEAQLTEIQDKLGDGVGSAMMMLQTNIMLFQETYLNLVSNQSFQDLTGQTLKRIITFVQDLETQIVKLLRRYKPLLGLTSEVKPPTLMRDAQASPHRQNQNQVDDLLSELGF